MNPSYGTIWARTQEPSRTEWQWIMYHWSSIGGHFETGRSRQYWSTPRGRRVSHLFADNGRFTFLPQRLGGWWITRLKAARDAVPKKLALPQREDLARSPGRSKSPWGTAVLGRRCVSGKFYGVITVGGIRLVFHRMFAGRFPPYCLSDLLV